MSRVISLRRAALVFLGIMAVCALLTACDYSGGTSANQGVISGVVKAGPTCGVEPAGSPAACAPKPVPGRVVNIIAATSTATPQQTPTGPIVASATTDAQGHFSVSVPPGDYLVVVASSGSGFSMRQINTVQVTVAAGQTVDVTIELDTGIR